MCLGCFSQFHLRNELFADGAGNFSRLASPTRRGFMAGAAAAATAAATVGSTRSAFAADGGADAGIAGDATAKRVLVVRHVISSFRARR